MSGKVEEVKLKISSNKVVVYSKSHCPYCKKAKSALADAGLKDYVLIELDEINNGAAFQDALEKITGARSVSRVLFYGTSKNASILLPRSVDLVFLYLFKWIVTKKPVRVEFHFQVLNYSSRLLWFVHGQKLSNFVVHSKIYL